MLEESELNKLCADFIVWFYREHGPTLTNCTLDIQDLIVRHLQTGFYAGFKKAEELNDITGKKD